MQKSVSPSQDTETTTARGRGRPRAFDREDALAKATHLFWRKGYEATSISDLTAVMGIGSPSLYAAFGSKEALYMAALGHYQARYEASVWRRFNSAPTAREAVEALLTDSAAALTGSLPDVPNGCMVTLSSVADHADLAELVRAARSVTLERLEARLTRAVAAGEVPASIDIRALARFVQTVQNGMSILARDGAPRVELEAVAQMTMAGWDSRVGADA
ncbi:TetR/AcrR family transcriptional regulator [Caulobacter sp. RHG1]|uniref:TetR/AcrR family transcriptional regulator n=1 Tax=Caulobacter sp. (strain RHG1) TaxID=2545762 RepID=UPI0015580A2C|nr:TetR/AcrR family transcriptional regulator [Caulobacter sp. RHG1]NQE60546.1 Transcriptional regulator, AcrR family [Caulobacter sp. RHG1]